MVDKNVEEKEGGGVVWEVNKNNKKKRVEMKKEIMVLHDLIRRYREAAASITARRITRTDERVQQQQRFVEWAPCV